MNSSKIAIVLSAGGARAAYQVGVLKYLADEFPRFEPKIFTGVSAGSINACFLAQGEPFREAAKQLYALWDNIDYTQVIKTNFESMFALGTRWVYDLFLSKVTKRQLMRSVLDAGPLAQTLVSNVHFWKISRALRAGTIEGLCVSATNYHDGTTTYFYDSTTAIPTWQREQRLAIRTTIRVRHILASCSIPLLFEPIRIGDYMYGDGALRFGFPLSPALHLGATHLLAIGIRCPRPKNPLAPRPGTVGIGFIAGAVLNSIFLDNLEVDFENLIRMNQLGSTGPVQHIESCLLRPTEDLGAMAREHLSEIPFHLRQLVKSLANPDELGDLMSYLMFSKGYVRALLKRGYDDAALDRDRFEAFLKTAGQA